MRAPALVVALSALLGSVMSWATTSDGSRIVVWNILSAKRCAASDIKHIIIINLPTKVQTDNVSSCLNDISRPTHERLAGGALLRWKAGAAALQDDKLESWGAEAITCHMQAVGLADIRRTGNKLQVLASQR